MNDLLGGVRRLTGKPKTNELLDRTGAEAQATVTTAGAATLPTLFATPPRRSDPKYDTMESGGTLRYP